MIYKGVFSFRVMGNSSIMIDLDDPRTAKIADVISNKTTKKILAELAERELSGGELSSALSSFEAYLGKLYADCIP